jgi:LacI family transcriptional regulator
MAISQKMIADALDISIITVSRALRNHPDLAVATRARVWEKARELGYRKLEVTQRVATKRVGILIYEPGSAADSPLESGVGRSIFLALQRECQRNQVETVIETPEIDSMPLVVRNGTVHAAFIFGRYTSESVSYLRNIPVLAVSSFIKCEGVPRIVADNFRGMHEATEHLIGLGHRRILFVGLHDPHSQLFTERSEGYLVAMHRHGLTAESIFCELQNPPIERIKGYGAVVCSNDALAFAIQERLKAEGVRVPEDCSIVAFDDLAQERKLTTYAPDWLLMGRLAANLLISEPEVIRGRNVVVTVPGRLMLRNSTLPVSNIP